MSTSTLPMLIGAAILLHLLHDATAGNGYHYNRPAISVQQPVRPSASGGHYFRPIPTIAPLPPVPELPPLPTPRSKLSQVLGPTFSSPSYTPTYGQRIASGYGKAAVPGAQLPRIVVPSGPSAPSAPSASFSPQSRSPYAQQVVPQYPYGAPSAASAPSAPSAPGAPPLFAPVSSAQASAQPLRMPFGKQAVISYPSATGAPGERFYEVNGRQLKQYAVVEIIDNDIELKSEPFLTAPFFDNIRARIGASGTGAIPALPSTQTQAQASAMLLAQQRLAQQRSSNGGNAVTLGSGGLGFIRLPNGNVYLGSGSLAFISGQDQTRSLQDARTRAEGAQPGALHFGHGALGGRSNFFPFK